MTNWDVRFLCLAKSIAEWSKDTSTKVGCVLVKDRRIISTGYNGLARNLNDDPKDHPERHDRQLEKYSWYVHAENNAIYNAALAGVSTAGSTAYVTLAPCLPCAMALIQAGVTKVVYDGIATEDYKQKGRLDITKSMTALHEAGVTWIGI